MNLRLPLVVAGLVSLIGAAGATTPVDPSGTWLTKDNRARVRIESCGPQNQNICGYIVWLKDSTDENGQPRLDAKNPDPSKRGRPILGHQMILGLSPTADGQFAGKLYNAENGKTYDVKLWREDASKVAIGGCMLAILCGSESWSNVSDVLPGQLMGPTDGAGGPRADLEWRAAKVNEHSQPPASHRL